MSINISHELHQDIVTMLKKYPAVDQAILFGSRARGDHGGRSDIDIALNAPRISKKEYTDIYFYFQEEFPTLLDVDLIQLNEVNQALRENILREGVVIYECDKG